MMYYYNGFTPFHIMGFGFMVIFWIAVILGITYLFKRASRHHGGGHSAIDILKERYAKGEITKHEFEEMKKEITKE